MSTNFWAEAATEPKRKFRYLLYFAGMPQFIAKTVTKPAFSVGTSLDLISRTENQLELRSAMTECT